MTRADLTSKHSTAAENENKNRYLNIVACEHTNKLHYCTAGVVKQEMADIKY